MPNLNDSIPDDDRYLVYGERDTIKVEYCSNKPNSFWQFGFNNLANNMNKSRKISFQEIYQDQGIKPVNNGYDFYIFERSIPSEILQAGLPKDGIVLLVDTDATINDTGLGISFNQNVSLGESTACTGVAEHLLTQYLLPERIHLSEYSRLTIDQDSQFKPLIYMDDDPILLLKDTPTAKLVVMPFSINMSDFYGDQFQIFLYNLVNYFMPVTLTSFDFELGDTTQFYCKGETIEVEHNGQTQMFSQSPSQLLFNDVGTYTFTTTFGLEKADEVRRVYVHVPTKESKLFAQSDFRINLNSKQLDGEYKGQDFFIWLAVASLILMVVEWYLQFKYIL